ncbi:MAG: lipoprotein-releasing system ATP-binding protein, partial [Blastocatellia bacterium]
MADNSKTFVDGAAVETQPATSVFTQSAVGNPQPVIHDPQFEPAQSAMIKAEGLTKIYESGNSRVVVFDKLQVEIAQGEMVAVVGPSGAGKSTLLHLLGGLDRASSGTVKVAEFDISKLSDVDLARFRNREIGFIFQFHHLLPEFSAVEIIMTPLLMNRNSSRAARERALS